MMVVADSSTLIGLASVSHLTILRELFGEIYIPNKVYQEICIQGKGRRESSQICNASWIKSVFNQNQKLLEFWYKRMDAKNWGEAEAIALAEENYPSVLLVDDEDAIRFATNLGTFEVLDSVDILFRAQKRGLIDSACRVLYEMVLKGQCISAEKFRQWCPNFKP